MLHGGEGIWTVFVQSARLVHSPSVTCVGVGN